MHLKSLLTGLALLCGLAVSQPLRAEVYVGIVSLTYSSTDRSLSVSGNNYNTTFYPQAKAVCKGATAEPGQLAAALAADANGWFRLRYDSCTGTAGIACFNGAETDTSGKYPLCLAVGTEAPEDADNPRPNDEEIFRGLGGYSVTGRTSLNFSGNYYVSVEEGNVPQTACKDTGTFKAFRSAVLAYPEENILYEVRPCGAEVLKICIGTMAQDKFAPQACVTQNKQAAGEEHEH